MASIQIARTARGHRQSILPTLGKAFVEVMKTVWSSISLESRANAEAMREYRRIEFGEHPSSNHVPFILLPPA